MTKVLRIVVLAGIWVALWGQVSVANVVFGFVVALVVTFGFPPLDDENGNDIDLVHAAIFFARFAVMLCQSTWSVVVEVVRPKLALEEAIVAVRLRTDDPVIITMVANGITLTPGTLTVDVGPDPEPGEGRTLYVHALTLGDLDDLVAGVHELEDLAVAAFPPPRTTRPPTPATEAAPPGPPVDDPPTGPPSQEGRS
jgi:multicomponent Na+:H+ antiporter subunit E